MISDEWAEIILIVGGSILLIAAFIIFLAAIFAAPGFVILMLAKYNNIGFWNSAAAGMGSIILITTMAGAIQTMRCKNRR